MKSKHPDTGNQDEMMKDQQEELLNEEANSEREEQLPDASIEETDPVSKMEARLTEANDKYLRLYSEFENYKKRVSRDKVEQSKMAAADIFRSFIPVLDDMERAMQSMND